jgi:hypothetical protein
VLELASAANVVATFTYTGSDVSYDWVQDAYISYYGRPADPEGQAYWAGQTDLLGRGLDAIVGAFGTSDEFNSRYEGLSNTALVTGIYQQTLARDPDPGGLAWYVGKLEAGDTTLQRITLDVLYGAVTAPDSTTVANKGEVADYYTAKVAAGCPYGMSSVDILAGVTADPATVTAAKAAIDAWCGP